MRHITRRLLALATLASLALCGAGGCAVGPDYARPKTISPAAFKESAPGPGFGEETHWKVAEPGTVDAGPWWTMFGDPVLNAFMPQLAMANPDIATARANLRQARAAVREATASFFPTIDAGGEISRGQAGGGAAARNSYSARLSASWELDLFGGIRRETESAFAEAEGSEAELAAMLLAMRAELAQNYFQLRSLDEQMSLYDKTIAAYEKSLQITRNQHQAGTVTRLDVAQAETQLKNARASAIDLDLERRQTEHAIASLLGLAPALLAVKPASLDARLPRIEAPIPAALLERRPDIAAAERRMAAANARIGVARSAYFPVFSLTGSGGYTGDAFHEWFTLPGRIWSVGAGLAQSVFQGGRLLARTDQAVASWEASVASYRGTVLTAFREVEDQLAATALLEREEAMQLDALDSARDAENLALSQYRGGIVTYLTVVNAQTTALASARAAAILKGRRFVASVALIRSLGGGWGPAPYVQPEGSAQP